MTVVVFLHKVRSVALVVARDEHVCGVHAGSMYGEPVEHSDCFFVGVIRKLEQEHSLVGISLFGVLVSFIFGVEQVAGRSSIDVRVKENIVCHPNGARFEVVEGSK